MLIQVFLGIACIQKYTSRGEFIRRGLILQLFLRLCSVKNMIVKIYCVVIEKGRYSVIFDVAGAKE